MRVAGHAWIALAVMAALVHVPSVRASTSKKTTLYFFYTNWCGSLCDDGREAIPLIQKELKTLGLSDKLQAKAVDCSSVFQGSMCCRHGVNTYPTVHVIPAGSDKFWVFQGERVYNQMLYALIHDNSPKAFKTPAYASAIGCIGKGLRYSTMWYFTRTMAGSALLGGLIGSAFVYVYVTMRAVKFGGRRSDWAMLVATVVVTYFLTS
eukprot:m.202635 g.202635  ORF g.202635 m.202635 type:complete len:207 (+) comp21832_c0_seq1:187-807(+)